MCLGDTVVTSLSLTEEVAGSSTFNDKHFMSHLGKTQLFSLEPDWYSISFLFNVLQFVAVRLFQSTFRTL